MSTVPTQFIALPPFTGDAPTAHPRRIAYCLRPGQLANASPAIVWLTGLKSAMISTKASALDAWAEGEGRTLLRFDYSGHGQSSGRFDDGRLGAWIEEAASVMAFALPQQAPRILVGSSTGAHVALMLMKNDPALRQLTQRLVLIAPAWDLTRRLMWDQFTADIRETLERDGVYLRPSRYGDGAYPITRAFLEEGDKHTLGPAPFDPGCAVHILHGTDDLDVPLAHGIALCDHLTPGRATLAIIPDGDHRLARPMDIARLLRAITTEV